VNYLKRQLLWITVVLVALTGCSPVEDLGKAIGDLLKKLPTP